MDRPAIVIRDIHHYGDDLTVPEATARLRGGWQVTVTVTDPASPGGDPRGNPRHGFDITVPVVGNRTVCAYAISSLGKPNLALGCVRTSGAPIGALDAVTRPGSGGALRVRGWALDPDSAASIPVHVSDAQWGAANTQQLSISPDLVVDVAHAGALTNLSLRAGELDNMASSRVGLAYRAPDPAQQSAFADPSLAFPRGFEIGGILAGLTTFQFTFARTDQTLLNTQGLPSDCPIRGPFYKALIRA